MIYGLRIHIECNGRVVGLALWVPWRHPSRPLIYAFWGKQGARWGRIFAS